MKVALGLKAHSGWAVLVAIGDDLEVVDRRRLELVEPADVPWGKAPYHAAEDLEPKKARELVQRSVEGARRMAVRELHAAVKHARDARHDVAACAVLVGDPMPDWSVEEILAVHFRMHKAEGVLFQDALVRAARACDVRLVEVPTKRLSDYADRALAPSQSSAEKRIAALGKSIGPPWGKDQKEAALAALIALRGRGTCAA